MTYILGLSAYYHDSAAVLLDDSEIIAAAQEERFTRKRHDAAFPEKAIHFCLKQANIKLTEIDHIVFYDKPFLKFERLLETHLATAPASLPAFIKAMPIWLKEKLFLKKLLRDSLSDTGNCTVEELPELLFTSHHQAHAASAYYASPYQEAVVLCLDGVGEWATTSTWHGKDNQLKPLWQIDFPHSLGLLYSAFTSYVGFRVNSGEYKLMGLAPYGEPKYVDLILENLIDIKEDGSFRLDMSYFNFASGLTMTSKKFHGLFGGEPRLPESDITQRDMDISRSIQVVTEKIVLRLARTLREQTGIENLCLAGGVALNCVANGRLLKENIFENVWVQPAAGDAGGALGAAYIAYFEYLNKQRNNFQLDNARQSDSMQGALLGTEYSSDEIENVLQFFNVAYTKYEDKKLVETVSDSLNNHQVVGWFQGKMEFGPRALGNRSILGDARSESMQSVINLKIKNRESFRPFAPAVLQEKVTDWFDIQADSPYMLFVSHLNKNKCVNIENEDAKGLGKLKQKRSQVPAVTHVDYTARVQTVSNLSNKKFHQLLTQFNNLTQCPLLINTSFNVRGEPIVESPVDALRCFMSTDMDVLAIGPFVLLKKEQPVDILEALKNEPLDNKMLENRSQQKATKESLKELRQFAVSTGIFVAIIFGWFIPWLSEDAIHTRVLVFSALWMTWGVLLPKTLSFFYNGWMRFGLMMSKLTTPLILTIIYCLLITPLGLIMRVFGHDPLNRKRDSLADTYKQQSVVSTKNDLEKPF